MLLISTTDTKEKLLDWSDGIDELVLFSLLTVGAAYLLAVSFELRETARLVPVIVLSILLGLLVLKLGIILLKLFDVDLFDGVLSGSADDDPTEEENDESQSIYDRIQSATGDEGTPPVSFQVRQIAWMVAFAAAMYVIGILYAIPLLLFTFIATTSEFSLLKNLVYTLIVWGCIYVIFFVILGISQYRGILI